MLLRMISLFLTVSLTDFIEIPSDAPGLKCELHLASPENPVGIALFSKKTCCVVHKGCFSNLLSAGLEAKSKGFQLKIVDALRPIYIQQALYAVIPDKKFVSEPSSDDDLHSRGLSVDVLLLDKEGNELLMPSTYFETSIRAFSDFRDCTEEERQNREILSDIMARNGFQPHPNRWWEFKSTYWESLFPNGKKALVPFNYSLDELICPRKSK